MITTTRTEPQSVLILPHFAAKYPAMVIIRIDGGKLRGKLGRDKFQKRFYSFQNIPYAEPPLGKLRFKAPQPLQPWEGIKDATKEGSESVSRDLITRQPVGSEDCLNLNVYTPELPKDGHTQKSKPVMVFIHGGVFMNGSNKTALYGPEFLMAEDVVLVTINYRLGVLGFLSLDDASLGVPGNAGFKDMVMALRWVQKNISYFSGDPNNVTVFGQSAGAAAAHLLMLSPMTKGLLHRVIAQSASALNAWVTGKRSAQVIAKKLGFSSSDDRKLLSFLGKVPAMELLKAQIKIDSDDFMEHDTRFFGVVVERPSNGEAFLTKHPLEIILSGDYNHVPLIMGYSAREGMAFEDIVPAKSRTPFFVNMELSVPFPLKIQRGTALSKHIADKIRIFYFGDVEQNREQHLTQYYDLVTDTSFLRDIYFSVKHHLKTSKKPIYFYKMSLETELNIFKKLTGITVPGMYHGDDLGYIFHTMFTPTIESGSVEDIGQKRVAKLWTNFARYGNPTPHPSDQILNVKWNQVDGNNLNYLEIGNNQLQMKVNPEHERIAFWEKIYEYNPVASKL